ILMFFFFSSRRRHTRSKRDWSSDVCSSDLKKDDTSHSETYLVYYNPEATEGDEEIDPDERAPTIEVFDIKDGETINNSIRTFHVKAKNYKGESITQTGEVTASNNGESVAVNWE